MRTKTLTKFVGLLSKLGTDGMSSDEEVGSNQYDVVAKVWRSTELVIWLRTLDALYRRSRENVKINTDRRGNDIHVRVPSGRINSRSRAVPGLPVNAYDPAWLSTLTPCDLEDLDVAEAVDLTFSVGTLE